MPTIVKPAQAAPKGYRMTAKANKSAEIWLYGVIGSDWFGEGVTAKQFATDLRALGDVTQIDLRINSEGGVVTDGRAMYNLLVEHKARIVTHIDGLAASAASFVAMAGDEIEIAEGGFVMIHNARGFMGGTAKDFRDMAAVLELVNGTIVDTYVARTKQTEAQIQKWMDAETWFTGSEAVANGFADRIVENMRVAASVSNPSRFRNMPAALSRPRIAEARALIAR